MFGWEWVLERIFKRGCGLIIGFTHSKLFMLGWEWVLERIFKRGCGLIIGFTALKVIHVWLGVGIREDI